MDILIGLISPTTIVIAAVVAVFGANIIREAIDKLRR